MRCGGSGRQGGRHPHRGGPSSNPPAPVAATRRPEGGQSHPDSPAELLGQLGGGLLCRTVSCSMGRMVWRKIIGVWAQGNETIEINYGNVGDCRSTGRSTPSGTRFPGASTTGKPLSSPSCIIGGVGCVYHTRAVSGLCILINHVQPAAGSWFYQQRQCQPPAVSHCSGQGPRHTEGPVCSHPSHPCQTAPRAAKELKQPQRPLLFDNFGAFHNTPYHAANSCAWAPAAVRGCAQPGRHVLCVRRCPATLVCRWFMRTPARGHLVL